MFDEFEEWDREVAAGVSLHGRSGGSGPPVLLLHGHPRTHTTWYRVAPLLVAAGHTVICPDLRGYGRSSKPASTPDHSPYSKRAMAGDALSLMRGLGHDRFAVAGHDRGSYVAMRLALDSPPGGQRACRAGLRADRRSAGPRRRAIRRGLVALVLLRPT